MRIFINDIPVHIIQKNDKENEENYDFTLKNFETIIPDAIYGNVYISSASYKQIDQLLKVMTKRKLRKAKTITIAAKDKEDLIDYLKQKFRVIEAGGGIVKKEDKILLIYRKNQWDIPKGKLDKGETIEKCAEREVEEETGVQPKIKSKITDVWHTYMTNRKFILKKTHWYTMDCLDDSKIKPQKKEGIEKVEWFTLDEANKKLAESYRSIYYVLKKYEKL